MDRKKAKEWGSDMIRTRISREQYILEERTWRDLKFFEWVFIVFSMISLLVSIGFSSFQLILVILDDDKKFIFPVLVILNSIFSAYFLWNGVIGELPFKLLVQLIIKLIVWVFDLIYFLLPSKEAMSEGVEESDTRVEIRNIRFYVSSAMLVLTLTSGGFVIYQYWTSNIAIFRTVGTEPKFVRLCRMYNFCQSMILFDAVAFATVIFHLWNFPYFVDNYSVYYLVPLCLLAMMVYAVLGIKATEKENRMLTYIFYVASHFQPIFIIFLLVKTTMSSLGWLLYRSIFVTSLVAFLAHIGLLISIVIVQNSYGMGLKQAAAREEERKQLMSHVDSPLVQNCSVQPNGSGSRPPPTETEL